MTATTASIRYRFGSFELQPDERLLLEGGAPRHLGQRAFDILVALTERGCSLVTKEELLDRIWPGVVVGDNTLQTHISGLRKVLGTEAIQTVSGRGYRFRWEVVPIDAMERKRVSPQHNIPHAVTQFIGREREMAEVKQLLATTRLLTLTGAGGCGKTRLATEVARRVLSRYADGASMVELAALASPDLVASTVARVLGVHEQPGRDAVGALVDHLAHRRLLLLLDNAEHLLESCAALADTLLRRCGELVILVTSRERLRIDGELTYRVSSLSLPDAGEDGIPERVTACESARLFIDRATLQQTRFRIDTATQAAALASVCRRLDGIALAIELAATRVRWTTIEELGRQLDERFKVLVEGSRTALPRHRTLRALIDWSNDLLGQAEKATLRRISVFSGGWTLEAAERVCAGEGLPSGAIRDVLEALVDKSLVLTAERGGAIRYALLETIRHYALDSLREASEETAARSAHLAYFAALVEAAEAQMSGAQQASWLDRIEIERDNLRSALAFAAASPAAEHVLGLRLAGAAWRFWLMRGHIPEGRKLLAEQLARPNQDPAAWKSRGLALHAAAILARHVGDNISSLRLGEESLEIRRRIGDRPGIASALGGLGNCLDDMGDYERARACHEESLAIHRELENRQGIGHELNNLAVTVASRGDLERARVLHEEALELRRELGDRWSTAASLLNLARLAHRRDDARGAMRLFGEAEGLYRELGDERSLARVWRIVAYVMCDLGDRESARVVVQKSLPTFVKHDDQRNGTEALVTLADAVGLSQPRHAATLYGATSRMREDQGAAPSAHDEEHEKSAIARARAALADDPAFDLAWGEGRNMTFETAMSLALRL